MASFRSDIAYPTEIVGQHGGVYFLRENATDRNCGLVNNFIPGGEVWPENPSGLPRKARFHKAGVPDEKWYLRHQKTKAYTGAHRTFFPESPLKHVSYTSDLLPHDSRLLFRKMVQHTVPENAIKAYEEGNAEFKKVMEERYKKVMKSPRIDPGRADAGSIRSKLPALKSGGSKWPNLNKKNHSKKELPKVSSVVPGS